jgi:chromatin remodeling complex protein RSC6
MARRFVIVRCPEGSRRMAKSTTKSESGSTARKSSPRPQAKPTAKPKSGKPNALQQPLTPSKELAAVVGSGQLPRGEVVKKVWDYIKKNKLQNPQNKREINADAKLKPIFGKDRVTMFEMNKHLAKHLS